MATERNPLAVLKQACDYLARARSFEVTAQVTFDEVSADGAKIELASRRKVTLRRPNGLRAEGVGDVHDRQVCFQDGRLLVYDRGPNVFAELSLPPTVDEAIDTLATRYDMILPLADLLLNEPYEAFTTGVEAAKYVGEHTVGEERCHHLLFKGEHVDWQAWVNTSKPILRKIVITYKRAPAAPQFRCVLTDWRFDVELTPETFVQEPPPDATRVEIEPCAAEVTPEHTERDARQRNPEGK